jgi:uncharacterized protein (TIGR04141 family)
MAARPPKWANFLNRYADVALLGKNQSTGAVLFVQVEGRLFGVTFGQGGRFILDQDCWEERFGLLVVLNSIRQDQIKTIDKSTFDALTTHSRIQTSKEASPQDFGIDIEQDLVRAVTGTPNDKSLGQRLTGMDALKSSIKTTIEELPNLLKRQLEQSRSTSYRETFPWVDHIAEVKGASLLQALNEKLVERIRAEEFDRCWMAIPEIIDWTEVDGFRYGFKSRNAKYHDLHLSDFIDEMKELRGNDFQPSNITLNLLKHRDVLCVGDDDQISRKWSLYSCLYCELDHEGHAYLLSGGKWYRVDRDFVSEVNRYFEQLPRLEIDMPEYDDESEEAYNARVCEQNPESFALMDRQLINYGGPRSGIEFCDIYTRGKDILHVKRYGQSKVFSHFFSQGTVSGELFHTQGEFRRIVNDALPMSHKLQDPRKIPDRNEYRVVFGIVSDAEGSALTIPFFSRLNLRAACNRLVGYGYRVAISKIPANEMRRKKKSYEQQKTPG